MKKTLLLIAFFSVALLIYKIIPFGDKETQTVANKKPVSQLTDNQKNLVAKSHKKKTNKSQKFGLKTDLEQVWFENDKEVPVRDYLDELIEAAESGNSTAQHHLSIVQRDCINVPDSEDSLSQRLQNLNDKEQEYLIDEYDWCEGYPRNLSSEKDWKNMTIKAARGGNSKAKTEFLAVSFSLMTPSELVSKSELVTELKREGVNHLIDAKNMGEKDALFQLAMTYHDGHMVQKDLKEAYAYYYAFSQFTSANFHSPDMVSIENELNIKQLQDAIKRGEKYANCCN